MKLSSELNTTDHGLKLPVIGLILGVLLAVLATPAARAADWEPYLEKPDAWFTSDEGVAVTKNILARQRDCGGWDKNYDPTDPPTADYLDANRDQPATIDNDATIGELEFLARVITVTDDGTTRRAFDRGLAYLFDAQYDNGGWPQYYPLRGGYHDAITYNDDAMTRVVKFMREIADGDAPYTFLPEAVRDKADASYHAGVQAILDTQVKIDGQLTAWCAQHDAETLAPTMARAYEHPSLSGAESVHIIRFLMSIDEPGDDVIRAVQSAVAWFDKVKLTGVSYERMTLPDGSRDRLLVKTDDPGDVWWARFYELGTDRPIFSDRDSAIRYKLEEVSPERRNGYAWYSRRADPLLSDEYPAWQKKWAPDHNVLDQTEHAN